MSRRAPTAGAIAPVAVLGLVCTAVAFVIFMVLIREAGTSRATVGSEHPGVSRAA